MKKFTLLLLLVVALCTCQKSDFINYTKYYFYSNPVFVGVDSILYIEYYTKMKETEFYYKGDYERSDADVKFKLINTKGQEISTIWQLSSADNSSSDFNYCYGLNYSNQSKTIAFSYSTQLYGESVEFRLMVMDLNGNVIKSLPDEELFNVALLQGGNFPVSPDGAYYVLGNRIKNTAGDVVKSLADTVVDWNANGLLVRNQLIDSARIDIEGTEYAIFSHPEAYFWYGIDKQYLSFNMDTINVCKWPDSSVLDTLVFRRDNSYGYYSPYGGGGITTQYNAYGLVSSSISPDLNFIVYSGNGIYLFDMHTGETKTLVQNASNGY